MKDKTSRVPSIFTGPKQTLNYQTMWDVKLCNTVGIYFKLQVNKSNNKITELRRKLTIIQEEPRLITALKKDY